MSVTNPNMLQSNGFLVSINRLPNISYWAQSVTLPGMSVTNPEQNNPFSRMPIVGDRVDFEPLVINFTVDEDLKNWSEIMRWFVGFGFPSSFDDFKFGVLDEAGTIPGSDKNFYSDISVTILSSHKNPIATFVYYNCVPASVTGIDMSVMDSSIEPIQCSASFEFSHFSILKPSTTDPIDIFVN